MKKAELKNMIHEEMDKMNEAYISFDRKLVFDKSKSLFPLLGDKQLNKGKLVDGISKLLKELSSLKTK